VAVTAAASTTPKTGVFVAADGDGDDEEEGRMTRTEARAAARATQRLLLIVLWGERGATPRVAVDVVVFVAAVVVS
jgi:hypothetical protein